MNVRLPWPGLPGYTVESSTIYTALPDSQTHRVVITLKNGSTVLLQTDTGTNMLKVADISRERMTLSFDVSGSNRTPVLYVGGAAPLTLTGTAVAAGTPLTLSVQHYTPTPAGDDSSVVVPNSVNAGDYRGIGLNARQTSTELLQKFRGEVNDFALARTTTPDDPGRAYVGNLLALAMASYNHDFDRHMGTIGGLTEAVPVHARVMSGFAMAEPKVNYFDDLQLYAVPEGFGVDIPNAVFDLVGIIRTEIFGDAAFRERMQLATYDASALEHLVIEELAAVDGISTARGIQWAERAGIRVLRYQKQATDYKDLNNNQSVTEAVIRTALRFSTATEDQIIAQLNQDYDTSDVVPTIVTVPTSSIQVNDWSGTVYFVEQIKASSYLYGAIIAPGLNGGYASDVNSAPKSAASANTQSIVTVAGDPVNVANGNMFRDEVDFTLPNIGMPIAFSRHYDSQTTEDFGLGVGWVFSYGDQLLLDLPNDTMEWVTSTGQRHKFVRDIADQWEPPASLLGTTVTEVNGDYVIKDKQGFSYTFNSDGRLIELRDRNDNALKIEYDTSSRPQYVTDVATNTRKLQFVYAGAGFRIDRVEDLTTTATTRRWKYEYVYFDGNNHLNKVTSPSDLSTTAVVVEYGYYTTGPLSGLISDITEPDGGIHTYTYYRNRRAFAVTDEDGFDTHFSYDQFRRVTTFADERGYETAYLSDGNGMLLRQIDPDGTRTIQEWDNDQLLLKSSTDGFGVAESYEYDAVGNLTKLTARDGLVTEFDYDSVFNRVKEIRGDPTGAVQTTQYTIDPNNGDITQIIDPLGNKTTLTYTSTQFTTSRGLVTSRTEPKGNVVSPDGDYTTTYEYNGLGLVTKEILPDLDGAGGNPAPERTFTYSDRGRLLTETDASGITGTNTYDYLDRRLTTMLADPDGTGPLGPLTTTFAYNTSSELISVTDAAGQTTTSAYDLKGNLVETRIADRTFQSFAYDGAKNRITSADELGRTTQVIFDERNRAVVSILSDGVVILSDLSVR